SATNAVIRVAIIGSSTDVHRQLDTDAAAVLVGSGDEHGQKRSWRRSRILRATPAFTRQVPRRLVRDGTMTFSGKMAARSFSTPDSFSKRRASPVIDDTAASHRRYRGETFTVVNANTITGT